MKAYGITAIVTMLIGCTTSSENQKIVTASFAQCVYARISDTTSGSRNDSAFANIDSASNITKILLKNTYHTCGESGRFTTAIQVDTLFINAYSGNVTSTCLCKSDITYKHSGILSTNIAWIKYEGALLRLVKN